MYQIFPEEENSNVKIKSKRRIDIEFDLDFFAKMAYQGKELFLAKMLFAANPIQMRLESGLRPQLVLSVAIYGLVLVPPGRGG